MCSNLRYFVLFLIGLIIPLATSQCLTDKDDAQQLIPDSKSNLYKGQQAFTVALLDAINKATPNENVFFSPYSTYHALLLAYFGAKNETEAQLKKALNLEWADNKYQVMQGYRFESQLRARRAQNGSVEFSAADKIFVPKEAELKDCMKNLFHQELETMDFAHEPEKCRQEINKWVEQVTKNQIKDILNEGDVTEDTNLVLANAAYFKGQWSSKFEPADTEKAIFYSNAQKQTFVDMMKQNGTFRLGINEKLGAHVLEMPYNGSDISMVIFLPPFVSEGLETILSRLTPETFNQALNEGSTLEIEVQLPKFSFDQTIELVPVLKQLGINDLFLPISDLSGFSEKKKLSVGDARHKAKIQVDEEGSTAAAATVLFTFRSARPLEQTKFICDHPFLFLIYDKKSDAVLFAGIYRDPQQ